MNENRWCPMAPYEDVMRDCIEENCAWWIPERRLCAMVALATPTYTHFAQNTKKPTGDTSTDKL